MGDGSWEMYLMGKRLMYLFHFWLYPLSHFYNSSWFRLGTTPPYPPPWDALISSLSYLCRGRERGRLDGGLRVHLTSSWPRDWGAQGQPHPNRFLSICPNNWFNLFVHCMTYVLQSPKLEQEFWACFPRAKPNLRRVFITFLKFPKSSSSFSR